MPRTTKWCAEIPPQCHVPLKWRSAHNNNCYINGTNIDVDAIVIDYCIALITCTHMCIHFNSMLGEDAR